MKPLTDEELTNLFRKHVPGNSLYIPDARRTFVGTPFYDFARELEHRSIATGMLNSWVMAAEPTPASADAKPAGELGAKVRALISWLLGF
jgi:hypothetical protein